MRGLYKINFSIPKPNKFWKFRLQIPIKILIFIQLVLLAHFNIEKNMKRLEWSCVPT